MKHLKKFQTTAEFEAVKDELVKPWVVSIADSSKPHYSSEEGDKPEPEPTGDGITRWYAEDGSLIKEVDIVGELTEEYKEYEAYRCEIGSHVTSIGDSAFYDCSSLTGITIPDSVTSIGYGVFNGCSSLTSVVIPNSVTSIGKNVFNGCSKLPVVDNLRYADTYLVGSVEQSITSANIKEGTKWISGNAFLNCSSLTGITIPDSVTSIGNSAFYGCSGLTSVIIPDSVTSIDDSAFAFCENLTKVEIPHTVTSISTESFFDIHDNFTLIYNGTKEEWCNIVKYIYHDPFRDFYNKNVYPNGIVHCLDGDFTITSMFG